MMTYTKRCVMVMVTTKHAQEMVPSTIERMLRTGSSASSAPKMMAKLVRWLHLQTAVEAVERRRSSSHPWELQRREAASHQTHSANFSLCKEEEGKRKKKTVTPTSNTTLQATYTLFM